MKCRDRTEEWIAEIVPDRSFVDIGGIGLDAVNERIGISIRSRAATSAMADIRPPAFHEWDTFLHGRLLQTRKLRCDLDEGRTGSIPPLL